jgi:hypothetical protein
LTTTHGTADGDDGGCSATIAAAPDAIACGTNEVPSAF